MEIDYSIEHGIARLSTGTNPSTGEREVRIKRLNGEGMTRGVWIPESDFEYAVTAYLDLCGATAGIEKKYGNE